MNKYINLVNEKTKEFINNISPEKQNLPLVKDKETQVFIYKENEKSKPRNATVNEIISFKLNELKNKWVL